MKKILIILLLVSGCVFCQEKQPKEKQPKVNRNEIKSNVFCFALGGAELSYEYILKRKHSIGSSIIIGYDEYFHGRNPTVFFRPFYKRYFFNKYGQGLFIKLVGNLNYDNEYKSIRIGPGGFLGYKIRLKDFIIELDVGLDTEIRNYKLIPLNPSSIIGIYMGFAF